MIDIWSRFHVACSSRLSLVKIWRTFAYVEGQQNINVYDVRQPFVSCLATFWGTRYFRGVVTFGGSLLSGRSLLSGFTSSHKKWTLLSGGRYFRGVVTIGTLRYLSLHVRLEFVRFPPSGLAQQAFEWGGGWGLERQTSKMSQQFGGGGRGYAPRKILIFTPLKCRKKTFKINHRNP